MRSLGEKKMGADTRQHYNIYIVISLLHQGLEFWKTSRVSSLDKNKYFLAHQANFFLKLGMGARGLIEGMFPKQVD